MNTLGDRVKEVREARRWSQAELAAEVTRRGFKITQAGISNIENRGATNPQCLPELAQALGKSVTYLRTGRDTQQGDVPAEGDELPPPNALEAPRAPRPPDRNDMIKDVPVFGTVSGGDAEAVGDFELNGEIVDHVRRPPRFAGRKDLFAAYVQGYSVSPWREPGQLIYLEAARAPKVMDYVLVELKPTRPGDDTRPALVKRLLGATPTKLKLRQYTPPKDFEIDLRRVLKVYRVLDWDELMGM